MASSTTQNRLIYLFSEKKGININKIYSVFEDLSSDELTGLLECVITNGDYDLFKQFCYYIHLFKDSDCLNSIKRALDLPVDLLEKLIQFSYLQALIHDLDVSEELDTLLNLFEQETYLHLLLKSQAVKFDKQLIFLIMTKMDDKHLDILFKIRSDMYDMLNGLHKTDNETLAHLLQGKDLLISYIEQMYKLNNNENSEIFRRYYSSSDDDSTVTDAARAIFAKFDISKERKTHLSGRNTERYALIVQLIHNKENIELILGRLTDYGAIIDEVEKNLITEIIRNPMLKNVYRKFIQKTNRDSLKSHPIEKPSRSDKKTC